MHSEASQELNKFREEAERRAEEEREKVRKELERQLQVFREEQEEKLNKVRYRSGIGPSLTEHWFIYHVTVM